MATAAEVEARRSENEALAKQIADVRAKQAADLASANNDVALERANREHDRLEAELATLMGVKSSSEVSAPPAPDTSLVQPEAPITPSDAAPTAVTTPAKPPKPEE